MRYRFSQFVGQPVAVLLACIACGQDTAATTPAEPQTFLENRLDVIPSETLPGLPVALIVTQRNTGSDPVFVPARMSVMEGSLRVVVQGPRGQERTVEPLMIKTGRREGRIGVALDPGASRQCKRSAGWTSSGPLFPEPGTYLVVAQVLDPPEVWKPGPPREIVVRSPSERWIPIPPREVVVRKPEGIDAEAFRLFPSDPRSFDVCFLRGFGISPLKAADVLPRLESLARDYGRTPYGQYVRYIMARQKSNAVLYPRVSEPLTKEEESDLLREAVELLLLLEADGIPENLRAEVHIELARYHLRLGETKRAAARVRLLEGRELPEPLAGEAKALRRTLSKRTGAGHAPD